MSAVGPRRGRGLPPTPGIPVPSDRRFRRPDIRPGRRRPGAGAVRLLARHGLPIVAVAAVAIWLGGAVLESRLLDVDRLLVRGANRLTQADVELLLDGLRGTSILSADLEAFRQRLLASPWVEDATLSRVLPSTITVRLVERRPIAVARVGQALHLVDGTGVIIEAYGPEYRDLDLPIVDGLVAAPAADEPAVDRAAIALAGRFLTELATAPDLHEQVSQVDVSNPHDAVVLLDGDPAWLHLGAEAFVDRLRRYLAWAPALRADGQVFDYVDLRLADRIVVREGAPRTEWSRE